MYNFDSGYQFIETLSETLYSEAGNRDNCL